MPQILLEPETPFHILLLFFFFFLCLFFFLVLGSCSFFFYFPPLLQTVEPAAHWFPLLSMWVEFSPLIGFLSTLCGWSFD